jgi:hypothetical protein
MHPKSQINIYKQKKETPKNKDRVTEWDLHRNAKKSIDKLHPR